MIILVFILPHFQEKLMTKLSKKSKKFDFGAILSLFYPNFGENEFSGKKASVSF